MSESSIAIRSRGWVPRALLREIPYDKPKTRLLDVDAARGLAIFLVVVGHVVGGSELPAGNEWSAQLKDTIYLFHMPLFMVLTGITFALSLPRFQAWSAVARFSLQRVERLFIPYVVCGLLVLAGKWAASQFLHVDNMPKGSTEDLFRLLLLPSSSVARFLWFIYVLSIYLLLVPALFQIFGRRPMLLLIVGVALQFGVWPKLFMLDRVVEYLPFFALGMLLWIYRGAWAQITPGLLSSSSALFAALLAMSFWLELPKWLVGVASVPAVLGWMQNLPAAPLGWLVVLGRASLAIYLLNTIAIGLTKGVMLKLLPWDGVNFLLYFPLLTLAGIAAPILVLQLTMRYFPRGARYLK
jgi:fucose 4-O-acetylase-like acetyltransferase